MISVIIPTFQAGALLRRCLEGLAAQTRPPEEVIVILSNPASAPDEVWRGGPWRLTLLQPGRRTHYGEAVNLGFAAAGGEDLVVLNDDTVPEAEFLEALEAARQRHGLAIYQPRIALLDDPARLDNVGHGLFFDGFNWARGREDVDGEARYGGEGTVGAVSGAAFWLPRAVLSQVGGFDEALEAFGEDVDLSLRAVRQGFALRYVPGARIRHELGASYGRYGARKVYLVERNRVRVAARSLPLTAVLTMPAWTAARWAMLAGGAAAGRGWGERLGASARLAAVAGAVDGVRFLPQALSHRRRDARQWRLGEAEMWRHLLRERVRSQDLLRRAPPMEDVP